MIECVSKYSIGCSIFATIRVLKFLLPYPLHFPLTSINSFLSLIHPSKEYRFKAHFLKEATGCSAMTECIDLPSDLWTFKV